MQETNLIQACLDEIRQVEAAGADRQVTRDDVPALLATPGFASELVAGAACTAGADWRGKLDLFKFLVERARLDSASRCRLGERFLSEARTALDALVGRGGLDAYPAVGLTRAFTRAGIEAPESLVAFLTGRLRAQAASGRLVEHMDAAIDWLERYAPHGAVAMHEAFDIVLGILPLEFGLTFMNGVSGGGKGRCARLIVYCLLHVSSQVRLRAACDLEDRASSGLIEPRTWPLLALVRSWMPADRAREILDGTLRTALRRGRFRPLERSIRRPVELGATLPTGCGAQTLSVSLEGAEDRATASIVLDAKRGVTDAFVLEYDAVGERKSTLAIRAGMSEVQKEALELMLSAALADGLAAGAPPAPGLIDVALACGLTALRPQPMTASAWLARLDPGGEIASLEEPERERLIGRSEQWSADHDDLGTWFEGTKVFDDAANSTRRVREAQAVLWERVEERRDEWAMLMLRAAHVLKVSRDDDEWRSFAATASAILDGRALDTIPIMVEVFSTTVDAWRDEDDVLREFGGTAAPGFGTPNALAARAG